MSIIQALVDTSVKPDPWSPRAGDVYRSPTALGWDRLIILAVHDVQPSVDPATWVPKMITFVTNKGEKRGTEEMFRVHVVCLGMSPEGVMRHVAPPLPAAHAPVDGSAREDH
jgi:hypothetical protein